MDGVSFSPVSSLSPQHQAGNQICHYRTLLACYGNKARHMFLCMCLCVCALQQRTGRKEMRKEDEGLSLQGVQIYQQQ